LKKYKWSIYEGNRCLKVGSITAHNEREAVQLVLDEPPPGLKDDVSYTINVGDITASAYGDEFSDLSMWAGVRDDEPQAIGGHMYPDSNGYKTITGVNQVSIIGVEDLVFLPPQRAAAGFVLNTWQCICGKWNVDQSNSSFTGTAPAYCKACTYYTHKEFVNGRMVADAGILNTWDCSRCGEVNYREDSSDFTGQDSAKCMDCGHIETKEFTKGVMVLD
jgi:hypothetical protein